MLSTGTTVRWINKREVDAKLIGAAPRILLENRAMVTQMLETVKAELIPQTPVGPGHFGYHLRESYRVQVGSGGTKTTGFLTAPSQGYWREYGTRGGYRGKAGREARGYAIKVAGGALKAGFSGGEKAGLYATKALNGVRKLISVYYGKAQWWRL